MPVSALKAIADGLVDVHGQHEHQSLLHADKHMDLLDDWCGKEALALRAEVAAQLSALNALRREREQLQTDARERARTLDLYRFQQEEIAGAKLRPGEEDELAPTAAAWRTPRNCPPPPRRATPRCRAGRGAAGRLTRWNAALAAVEHAAALDETLSPVLEALQGAVSYAEDASHELRGYQETVEFNPERLEEIETASGPTADAEAQVRRDGGRDYRLWR